MPHPSLPRPKARPPPPRQKRAQLRGGCRRNSKGTMRRICDGLLPHSCGFQSNPEQREPPRLQPPRRGVRGENTRAYFPPAGFPSLSTRESDFPATMLVVWHVNKCAATTAALPISQQPFHAEGFRVCGRDPRAFRSPLGILRTPSLVN